jgi:hypothetical protein
MLQRVIVIALVLCSHISLCAGSLFSVSMAFASHIATSDQEVVMTPDAHTPLCMLLTPKGKQEDVASDDSCGGGKKCSGTPSVVSYINPLTTPDILASAVPATVFLHRESAGVTRQVIRNSAGPPGERHGLLIASVVRRE